MRRAGGQAVFEGVMMRGTDRWAVAVRTPTGAIEVMEAPLPTWGRPLKDIPVVRGVVALAEALPLGFRALTWSAEHGLGQVRRRARWWERALSVLVIGIVVVVASAAPAAAARHLARAAGLDVLGPFLELVLGVAMLYGYLRVVGRLGDIVRLFANHGAEHKVVNAYESGAPMTVESVQSFSTRHPRCGTSFLLLVAIVSAVVFAVIGASSVGGLVLTRVLALPLVAGIAAELQLRLAEVVDRPWARVLARPGMALQRLTTREPTDEQAEVAMVALRAVLTADELAGCWWESSARSGPTPRLAPSAVAAA